MGVLVRCWRWLLANAIDLWKGAAVATLVIPALLIFGAVEHGIRRPLSWLLLALAVAMVPLALYCSRRYVDNTYGRDRGLPPLDRPPGAEPPVHVRRVE